MSDKQCDAALYESLDWVPIEEIFDLRGMAVAALAAFGCVDPADVSALISGVTEASDAKWLFSDDIEADRAKWLEGVN